MPFSTSFSLPSSSGPSGDVVVVVVVAVVGAALTSGLTSGSATADETLVLFWKKRLGNMVAQLLCASLLAHTMRIVKSKRRQRRETNDAGENGVQTRAQGTAKEKKTTT
jgi:hypothetical protein